MMGLFFGSINGSELIDSPWETVFSAFTDLFGTGFYLFPLVLVSAIIFVKTRDIVTVGGFMLASGAVLASVDLFSGYPEMSFVFVVFATIGIIALVLGLYFNVKR